MAISADDKILFFRTNKVKKIKEIRGIECHEIFNQNSKESLKILKIGIHN